ncbi:MAG TPA: archaellum operon transcriptional activator EarA family protein [Candidatus Thermoplasmatota archaeon]|nr:archaellum operon transcriptional activator EarA family protein [Candidatus Thermoplasmatota archaeon]
MPRPVAAHERSVVRSSLRDRTLILLSSLSEAYPNQLAKALGTHVGRLRSVMQGDPADGYSRELALVPLGLVEERETRLGRLYAITEKGRRKARQLTSRRARRARLREMERAQRADVRPATPAAPGDRPPGAPAPPLDTASFRWSVEG